MGADKTIPLPPVDSVCCSDAHNSSALSTNAASSIITSDKASERPDVPVGGCRDGSACCPVGGCRGGPIDGCRGGPI